MPLAAKYKLIENLWKHVGPKSTKALRVGLDVDVEQALNAVRVHIEEVVIRYRIPESLEKRFNWLAAGDSHVKQELLNYLRHFEKTLVVEGARLQLPIMLAHLRGEAGRQTHRLTQVLKIGNHELELPIDKNALGVSVVEPRALRSTAAAGARNNTWVWWIVAAIVILFLIFARR